MVTKSGTISTLMYDPPSGWRYGFPKPYKPDHKGEPLAETLFRDGYPLKEIAAGGDKHVRFFTYTEKELCGSAKE